MNENGEYKLKISNKEVVTIINNRESEKHEYK